MFMNIDSLIKVMDFQWLCIVPAIFAFIMISIGGIGMAFTVGGLKREKSSKKTSEAIIKRFKKCMTWELSPQGILSPSKKIILRIEFPSIS
jgi:hypothetical protein